MIPFSINDRACVRGIELVGGHIIHLGKHETRDKPISSERRHVS